MAVNPTILEWMFAREMCRRLGFTPEEIFFAVSPSGRVAHRFPDDTVDLTSVQNLGAPVVGLEIRRGERTFLWTIGAIDLPLAQIEPVYLAACEDWNAGRAATLEQFQASQSYAQAYELVTALRARGFQLSGVN